MPSQTQDTASTEIRGKKLQGGEVLRWLGIGVRWVNPSLSASLGLSTTILHTCAGTACGVSRALLGPNGVPVRLLGRWTSQLRGVAMGYVFGSRLTRCMSRLSPRGSGEAGAGRSSLKYFERGDPFLSARVQCNNRRCTDILGGTENDLIAGAEFHSGQLSNPKQITFFSIFRTMNH